MVAGQEATPEAAVVLETASSEPVAVADGVTVGGVVLPFDYILEIIQWGVVVVFFVLIYKSVPSNLVDDGIRLARKGAGKTDTPIDDEFVEMVARLWEQRQRDKPEGEHQPTG